MKRIRSDSRDLVIIKLPTEIGEVLPASGQGPPRAGLPPACSWANGERRRPERAGCSIGRLLMGALGCVDLLQRLQFDRLEDDCAYRGHVALFDRSLDRTGGVELATDGLRSLVGGAGRHCSCSLFALTAVLGNVYFQYGHCGADGPRCSGGGERVARFSLSLRDDRCARRFDCLHDASLFAREHAGG